MLYKFDNDKYELCKKYIMEVYDGNKKNVEMYDVSKSIIVSENSVNDFMDAADYAIIHFGMINQDYCMMIYTDKQRLIKSLNSI